MNQQWKNKQRKNSLKIAAYILVATVIFIGVMCWAASSYFANKRAVEANQTQQVSHHENDNGIGDGRILLIGIVVLAILSAFAALVISGRYTTMISAFLIIGALNFIAGNILWNTNNPDPKDCVRFSLEFCGGLAVMDLILLVIMAAYGLAERKDSGQLTK